MSFLFLTLKTNNEFFFIEKSKQKNRTKKMKKNFVADLEA